MFGIYMTKDQVLRGREFITMDDFDNWETICTKNNALFCHAFYDEGNVVLDRFNMKLTDELAMSLREFCVKQFDTNAISINSDYDDDIFHYNLDPDDETYSEKPVNEPEQIEAPEQETEIEQTEEPIKEEREVINETPIADNTIGNYTFHFVWEGKNCVHKNQTYQQAIAKYQHSVLKNVTCRVMRGTQEIAHYTAVADTPVVQAIVEKPAPYVGKHATKAVSAHGPVVKVEHEVKETPAFRGAYAFLSNMYESPIKLGGITYTCAEAAFQAAKLSDKNARAQFAGLTGPEAKRLGRQVTLRPDWEKIKLDVMRCVIHEKFAQNPQLAAKLKATGNTELVENNGHNDTFWGRCNRKGQNWLGVILTEERTKMK